MELSGPKLPYAPKGGESLIPKADSPQDEEAPVETRAYQLEMFEHSMRSNVIVTVRPLLSLYLAITDIVRWTREAARHGGM
jgi:hypothetical protein